MAKRFSFCLFFFLVLFSGEINGNTSESTGKLQNIAKRWQKLSGEDHWNGLLHPLDGDLARYLIHYGEMVKSTYDIVVKEAVAKFGLQLPVSTIWKKLSSFLWTEEESIEYYKVTKYLYAVSSLDLPVSFIQNLMGNDTFPKESNWIGYVAVATDEGKAVLGRRDIVVAWRGSIYPAEWIRDLDEEKVSTSPILSQLTSGDGTPMVYKGFFSVYTSSNPSSKFTQISARDQALAEVNRLVRIYKDDDLSITTCGHSLGAALSTLNAIDITANAAKASKPYPVTAFTYASPRVGDVGFKTLANRLIAERLHILRIVNALDMVPKIPPPHKGYFHVGQEISVNASLPSIIPETLRVLFAHEIMYSYLSGIESLAGK